MKNGVYEKIIYSAKGMDDSDFSVIPFRKNGEMYIANEDGVFVSYIERNVNALLLVEKGDMRVAFSFNDLLQDEKVCSCSNGEMRFSKANRREFSFVVYTNGISGKVILRQETFEIGNWKLLFCNLMCQLTTDGTVEFINPITGKSEFYLSVPYLEDSGGKFFSGVAFKLDIQKQSTNIIVNLDKDIFKRHNWGSPLSIHWRIIVPEKTNISTYSKLGKRLVELPFHFVGGEASQENEMYLKIKVPNFESSDVVEKVYLSLTHSEVFSDDRNVYNLELYKIASMQTAEDEIFVDSVPLHHSWSFEYGDDPIYTFDITNLFKECINDGLTETFLKVKLEKNAKRYENYVVLHGATSNFLFAPKMKIMYKKRNSSLSSVLQKGDLVAINKGSHYKSGHYVPDWILMQKWYVDDVLDDFVIVKANEFGLIFDLPPIPKNKVSLIQR